MTDRRMFLKASIGGLALAATGGVRAQSPSMAALGFSELPQGMLESTTLEALPGKLPLFKKSFRAPNYETPVEYFNQLLTPNRAFFVRYHLSNIPEVSAREWRLRVGGEAASAPFEIDFEELKRMPATELIAVCQCSGNRRGLFQPHVAGVEWGVGAMGNARWKGVRLRDLLNRAGLRKDALEILVNGADSGALPQTPDFVKTIPTWKAMDENTLVAYEMNGEPLPHWNGFPARLIVPGWTGTYWMKHLVEVSAITKPFGGFWMNPAYRIPKGKFALVDRFLSQETDTTTPITEMVVNSLITTVTNGQRVPVGQPVVIGGVAWDGGYGIQQVEVSLDGGISWQDAQLGEDHGRFSFRQWSLRFTPTERGTATVMAKATNRIGQSQTFTLNWNPAGYHHNVVQRITLQIV